MENLNKLVVETNEQALPHCSDTMHQNLLQALTRCEHLPLSFKPTRRDDSHRCRHNSHILSLLSSVKSTITNIITTVICLYLDAGFISLNNGFELGDTGGIIVEKYIYSSEY